MTSSMTSHRDFPIVCVILALDSWHYCSGEQGLTAQHLQDCLIFFIQLNNVYKRKINEIRCCHLISPSAKRWHTDFFNETTQGKDWEEDIGLFGLALQSNSSNTSQTIEKLFAFYWWQPCADRPTFARLYISQCLTLTKRAPTHWGPEQHNAQNPEANNLQWYRWKKCLAGVEMLDKSPTRETPATKATDAAAPREKLETNVH